MDLQQGIGIGGTNYNSFFPIVRLQSKNSSSDYLLNLSMTWPSAMALPHQLVVPDPAPEVAVLLHWLVSCPNTHPCRVIQLCSSVSHGHCPEVVSLLSSYNISST